MSSPQGGNDPERRGDRSSDRGQNHERRRGRPQWWDEALLTRLSPESAEDYNLSTESKWNPLSLGDVDQELPAQNDFFLAGLQYRQADKWGDYTAWPRELSEIKSLRLVPQDCIFWDYQQGLLLTVCHGDVIDFMPMENSFFLFYFVRLTPVY